MERFSVVADIVSVVRISIRVVGAATKIGRLKNGRAEARPYSNWQNRRARIPYALAAFALTPL
jgi:hypothetical protein